MASAALAASPVTINNAANTDSAAITSHALNVTVAGSSVTQDVNLKQVNGHTALEGGVNGSQAVGGTAASGAAVAGNPVLAAGSDGTDARTLATDAAGNLGVQIAPTSSSTNGITAVVSASAEGSHVLKASAGNLYSIYVTTGVTAGYLMVFNATSAPVDGAVTPNQCVWAPANATTSVNYGSGPPGVYSTGITAVFSSTGCFTKTASATAFFHGRVK